MERTVKFITRDMIRAIKPMTVETFYLPSVEACVSARVQVTHVHNTTGNKYRCHVEPKGKKVVIMRIA